MGIKGILLAAWRSIFISIDKWTEVWENDAKYVQAMQKEDKRLSNYNISMMLVSPFSTVLSLGCGAGREVKSLVGKQCKVTAIDRSKKMIELSKEIEPNAEYLLMDFRDHTKKEKYDFILCLFNTINYLESKDERAEVIRKSYSNLKAGGELIIETSPRNTTLGTFIRGCIYRNDYYYSKSQIDLWFKGTKFKVEKLTTNQGVIIVAIK